METRGIQNKAQCERPEFMLYNGLVSTSLKPCYSCATLYFYEEVKIGK